MCFLVLAVEGGLSGPEDPAEYALLVRFVKVSVIPVATALD
jgi:hypothetical protein